LLIPFETVPAAIAVSEEILSRASVKNGGVVPSSTRLTGEITFNELVDIAHTVSVICNNTDPAYLGKTALCVWSTVRSNDRAADVAWILAQELKKYPGVNKTSDQLARLAAGYLEAERKSRLYDKRISIQNICDKYLGISKQAYFKSISWVNAGNYTRQIICDYAKIGENQIADQLIERDLMVSSNKERDVYV
jgi:hypothetical protein